MSYDGFYGELSTRGTVSELLNQANSIKVSIEASEAEVAADTSEVGWKHAEVTLKAAQVQTDANLVSTKAQEVTLNAAQVQTNANLVSTKAQEVTLKAAQVQTDANLVSTKAQEVTLNAAQVQTNANLVSTKAQEVTLKAAQVQTDANLVSTKAQEVTLKAAQVQTNATLVETKAQEVQDNSDYVAGIAAHYPPDVIGTADPRLTDAREWTAVTISQSEVEDGTAATRRAFTAQRVRQAIVAWWNSVTGVFGRDLVTSANNTAARSKLGLGSAATRDVGTASGNVMEVGAFGVGHTFLLKVLDANEIADLTGVKSGFYPFMSNGGSLNVPHDYVYIQQLFYPSGNVTQIAYGYNKEATWVRYRYAGVWSPWVKQLSTNDILQATGTSTTFPMTQKATRDAIANIPSVPKSAEYDVTAADKGASIDTSAGVNITANLFAVGDVIVVTNTSASSITIGTRTGVTIRLAGTASTGARTLAGYGVATFRMVSNNVWFGSGAGLS